MVQKKMLFCAQLQFNQKLAKSSRVEVHRNTSLAQERWKHERAVSWAHTVFVCMGFDVCLLFMVFTLKSNHRRGAHWAYENSCYENVYGRILSHRVQLPAGFNMGKQLLSQEHLIKMSLVTRSELRQIQIAFSDCLKFHHFSFPYYFSISFWDLTACIIPLSVGRENKSFLTKLNIIIL